MSDTPPTAPTNPVDPVIRTHRVGASRGSSPGRFTEALLNILKIPLFPLLMIGGVMFFRTTERQGTQVLMFANFSSLIYTWPILVVGFVGWLLVGWGWADPAVMGWVWIFTLLVVLITLGTDIHRDSAVVWLLGIGLILALGALLNAKYQIPVLHNIYQHFSDMKVAFDRGTAIALTELLAIVHLIILIQAVFDGRHEISSRELTHRRLLRASEAWPLTINRVRLEWPDLLEMITLFGAGHLVVIDQDRKEVMRIRNIPFLWFFRERINNVLDVMATTEVAPSEVQ